MLPNEQKLFLQVTIFEQIKDFQIILKYIPKVLDQSSHPGFMAGGPEKNKLPQDTNVTFFFDYLQGKPCLYRL